MKEDKGNSLLQLGERIKELSGGLCEIGPGPYGIGASAVCTSEIGFYLVFHPKCYTETETFPKEISEYSVSLKGLYHSDNRDVKPEELERLVKSENPDTAAVAKMLKELEGEEIKVSREVCVEAFDVMAEKIRAEIEKDAVSCEPDNQSQDMGMIQQL